MAHTKMNKIAEIVVSRVKTCITDGETNSKHKPIPITEQEKIKLRTGTDVFDSLLKALELWPAFDIPNSMRLVAKTPLFAADMAEVMTTKLMTAAAAGRPAMMNSCTNGLLSADISAQDETEMIAIKERM